MIVVLVLAALATYHLNETRGRRRERLRADPRQVLRRRDPVRGTRRRPARRDRRRGRRGRPAVRHRLRHAAVRRRRTASRATSTEATQIDADGPPRRPRHAATATVTEIAVRARHLRAVGDRSWRPCSGRTRSTCRPSTRSRPRSTRGWRTSATVTVVLPNQQRDHGHVAEIKVETVAGEAQAVRHASTATISRGRRRERARVRGHAGHRRAAPGERRRGDATAAAVKTYVGGLFG